MHDAAQLAVRLDGPAPTAPPVKASGQPKQPGVGEGAGEEAPVRGVAGEARSAAEELRAAPPAPLEDAFAAATVTGDAGSVAAVYSY